MIASSILPKIHAISPLSTYALLWRTGGAMRLTVIAKATFTLVTGREAALAPPEPIELESQWLDDDPARSLRAAADVSPYLPNAGVLLTGHAYAPGGNPVSALSVRLAIFAARPLLDKTIHIFGDVVPGSNSPAPFRSMPLVYERCVGGPGVPGNPVGIHGGKRPNLVDPQQPGKPAGFGPIAPHWPARRALFGSIDSKTAFQQGIELPENFDFRAYNPAPLDQQIPYLRGDEWIVMDNLSPSDPRVETRLPSVRARARKYVLDAPNQTNDIYLAADTLVIDTDRMLATLTWRGHFVFDRIESMRNCGIMAGLEQGNQPLAWPEPEPISKALPSSKATQALIRTAEDAGSPVHAPALPFRETSHPSIPQSSPKPFAPPANPAPPKEPPGDPLMRTVGIGDLMAPNFAAVLPFQGKATPAPAPPPPPAPKAPENPVSLSQTVGVDALISPFAAKPLPFRGGPAEPAQAPDSARPEGALPGAPWSAVPAKRVNVSDDDYTHTMFQVAALRRQEPPAPPPMVNPPPPVATPPEMASPPAPLHVAPPAMVAPVVPIAPPPAVEVPAAVQTPPPSMPAAESLSPPAPPSPPTLPAGLDRNAVVSMLASNASLEGADFSGADLSGLDFGGRSLSNAVLKGAKLRGARLSRATLRKAVFDGADVVEANFEDADMAEASFSGADAQRARFTRAKGRASSFRQANLTGADLSMGEFEGADFSDAVLRSAVLDQGDFAKARLDRADLANTSFRKARLSAAILANARIELTDFRGANLDQANVFGAPLRKAKLAGASMNDLNESEPR